MPGLIAEVLRYCVENEVPLTLIQFDSLETAKDLPCVFNNWAAFYSGKFLTVNLADGASLLRMAKRK